MVATNKQAYQSGRHLPADLFPEILSRLPVKSLLRFRCVSKPWLSLVDDDGDFARLHLQTFKNNRDETGLFVLQSGIQHGRHIRECFVRCSHEFRPISNIPLSHLSDDWYIVTSLHGLILLIYPHHSNTVGHFGDLKVWNPSIRKLLEIPALLKPEIKVSPTDFIMDKDIGLGYDLVANNYKLVKLIRCNKALHSVAIYAIGADSWKIIYCSNWQWDVYSFGEAVYFRGSLYFIASNERRERRCDLIWFDLSKEVFSSARLPDDPFFNTRHYNLWRLASVGDGFIVKAFDLSSSEVYVWVVDTESMCWKEPHLYSFRDNYLFHVMKNGDMLKWRINNDTSADRTEDVTIYIREMEGNKTLQLQLDSRICYVSCYVESLLLHKMN